MGNAGGKKGPADLDQLTNQSKYTTPEIKAWSLNFRNRYPQGHISKKEFSDIYCNTYTEGDSSTMAEQVFRVFDTNADGKIDFRELVIGLGLGSRGTVDEKLDLMFSLYDINGDGMVTKEEMQTVMTSMLMMSASGGDGNFRASRQSFSLRTIDEKAADKVEQMFNSLDLSGDGLVSHEEFMALGEDSLIMEVFSLKC